MGAKKIKTTKILNQIKYTWSGHYHGCHLNNHHQQDQLYQVTSLTTIKTITKIINNQEHQQVGQQRAPPSPRSGAPGDLPDHHQDNNEDHQDNNEDHQQPTSSTSRPGDHHKDINERHHHHDQAYLVTSLTAPSPPSPSPSPQSSIPSDLPDRPPFLLAHGAAGEQVLKTHCVRSSCA